jgi:hypothetical protein
MFLVCLLVLSRDGLILLFLDDFADAEETILYEIDLD